MTRPASTRLRKMKTYWTNCERQVGKRFQTRNGMHTAKLKLWIPCGSSDPDSAIYVFQGRGRKWDLVLATESDFNAIGEHQVSGMDYRISPPDSSGKWFVVVGHVPPSCKRAADVLRYKALRPSSEPDKPTVLVSGRVAIDRSFDPAFRIEAHEDWFAVTIGKTRKLDDEPGVEIFRYDVSDKQAVRIAPLALLPQDFLDQWTQLSWEESKRWSSDLESLAEWHRKLNELTPGTAEIEAVRRCRGAEDGDQDWEVELSVAQAPNPSFGGEVVYIEVAKRNGIFSVMGIQKNRLNGCSVSNSLTASTPPNQLPVW